MKKTIGFPGGMKILLSFILTGFFLIVGSETINAQENAQGSVNPYTHIASKLDVTAYPFGTFENAHSINILEQIVTGLKPLLGSGGGSQSQKLKYDYCNKILADVKNNYIAVELSLLTSLSALTTQTNSTQVQGAQLRALYNEIVNQLD